MDTQELLSQYASGERNFSRVNLIQVCLTNANLIGVHLTGAYSIEQISVGPILKGQI